MADLHDLSALVAPPYDDVTAIRAGAALERVRTWLDVPARRPQLELAAA